MGFGVWSPETIHEKKDSGAKETLNLGPTGLEELRSGAHQSILEPFGYRQNSAGLWIL
jgi:hypothetical protein